VPCLSCKQQSSPSSGINANVRERACARKQEEAAATYHKGEELGEVGGARGERALEPPQVGQEVGKEQLRRCRHLALCTHHTHFKFILLLFEFKMKN
jgi:hypothetical protein